MTKAATKKATPPQTTNLSRQIWMSLGPLVAVVVAAMAYLAWTPSQAGPLVLTLLILMIGATGLGAFMHISKLLRISQQDKLRKINQLSSELAAARHDLSQEAYRSQAIVNHMVDGIVIIDSKGVILDVNPAVTRIFGYPPHQMIGKNVKMLASGRDRANHDTYLSNYLKTGKKKIMGNPRQVTGYRADTTKFPLDLAVTEMNVGGVRQFIGVLRDLTGQTALEDQLRHAQKMESVGQLTGGLAHDFNNLLAVIRGNLGLLRTDFETHTLDGVTEESRELCEGAIHAADKGAELTKSLLAFSRKQTLQPVIFDANEAVISMETLLKRTLEEDIDLEFNLKPTNWHVKADRAQLESAILNLAVNARDAMKKGGALTIETVDVTLDESFAASHDEVTAGDYVLVAVSDDGPGMTKDILAHVMEPFFTTKEIGQGSGLGLSMVFGFAKQSGGHLSIYSEIGKGTSVKLYLPRATGSTSQDQPAAKPASTQAGGEETILVVEDDDDLRLTVKRILARRGYNVLIAGDGSQAIDTLSANGEAIELVLSDIILPGPLDGPHLADEIKQMGLNIPTLFMSGYTKSAIAHRGDLKGEFHLINKPFSPDELSEKVREVLDTI
jgi:PAS domain S-box-containing protein